MNAFKNFLYLKWPLGITPKVEMTAQDLRELAWEIYDEAYQQGREAGYEEGREAA